MNESVVTMNTFGMRLRVLLSRERKKDAEFWMAGVCPCLGLS